MADSLFTFEGVVERGRGLGKAMGFPTANVRPRQPITDFPSGVFAGWIDMETQSYPAAIVIGAPGITEHLEVYLFDFDGDLYGKMLKGKAVNRVRDMQQFSTTSELIMQIQNDCNRIRSILNLS